MGRADLADDRRVRELFEDAYAFSTSFATGGAGLAALGIDFEGVDQLLRRAEACFGAEAQVKQAVAGLVELFQSEYEQSARGLESALMVWRGLLMVLQVEHLHEWEWQAQLVAVLRLLRQTDLKDPRLVEYLAAAVDKARVLGVVQKVHGYLSISIMSGAYQFENIETAIRVIDVFHEANKKKRFRARLDYREFYNDAINKDVHLDSDFKRWIQERERCRALKVPFDRLRVFTLCSFPWILDSAHKAELLKIANRVNQQRQEFDIGQLLRLGHLAMNLVFEVRRDHILDDALRVIARAGSNFQKPMRVIFQGEPGIDEGGVRKEFFQLLVRELFKAEYGMFSFNEKTVQYYINGLSHEPNVNFELIGVLMGLAIYNNVILDVSFPQAVYKQLLFEEPDFDDLREWQPEIAQSLEFILNYEDPACPLETVLGTTFTFEVESYGHKVDVELKPNGAEVFVNEANRQEYVDLYVHYTFVRQCEDKLRAFKRGFYKVCDETLMRDLFKPEELEQLICGSRVLDFNAWEENCKFVEGYTEASPQAKWLWEVVHEDFDDEQRRKFLAFVTGSDRAPINGLGTVKLYVGRHGEDSEMLPSSHTCFNHLLIPEYSSKEKLRAKLLLAISNAEGFGLM